MTLDVDSAADRPTLDEIEITPEMISAANDVLREHYMGDRVYDLRDPCLMQMYRAMPESRPR